jgi:hypothetical protein
MDSHDSWLKIWLSANDLKKSGEYRSPLFDRGNDTYYAATANDYETLAALQVVLNKLRKRCRVVIVESNPRDGSSSGDKWAR